MSSIFSSNITPKRKLVKKKWPSTPTTKTPKTPSTPQSPSDQRRRLTSGQDIPFAGCSKDSREIISPSTPRGTYIPSESATTPRRRPNLCVETDSSEGFGSYVDEPPSSAPELRQNRRSEWLQDQGLVRPAAILMDDFIPQQSPTRRIQRKVAGDNDTWIEIQVVMTRRKERRKRSLFYSVKTQLGVWDEPPSGASNIILRNEMRSLADEYALSGGIH